MGTLISGSIGSSSVKANVITLKPGYRFELFNTETYTQHSPVFRIKENNVVMLSLYGSQPDDKIVFSQVLLSQEDMPSGDACDFQEQKDVRVLGEHTLSCNSWLMNDCKVRQILDLPGDYRANLVCENAVGHVTLIAECFWRASFGEHQELRLYADSLQKPLPECRPSVAPSIQIDPIQIDPIQIDPIQIELLPVTENNTDTDPTDFSHLPVCTFEE